MNTMEPVTENQTRRKATRCKLRSLFILLGLLIFLPLMFVQISLTSSTMDMTSSTVLKTLDGFYDILPQNDTKSTDRNNVRDTPSFRFENDPNPILTAYLEPIDTLTEASEKNGPFIRNTSKRILRSLSFPNTNNCSTLMQNFPVDNFPKSDGWLPWIHDYFPSLDGKTLHFVAQNRRKCHTGDNNTETMKFWAPQIALFQGIPVVVEESGNSGGTSNLKYRLASSFNEATNPATRFQCRFHNGDEVLTTLSAFPFDYDFINWRKQPRRPLPMMASHGSKDASSIWLSQLRFSCPIPEKFQYLLSSGASDRPALYVDLVPIRTPISIDMQLLLDRIEAKDNRTTNSKYLEDTFGRDNAIPPMDDAGRWQNLPVCRRSDIPTLRLGNADDTPSKNSTRANKKNDTAKPYRLVACTWTSSNYFRRGEMTRVFDVALRLREWLAFHFMTGFDHIYVYDNTDVTETNDTSEIYDVIQSFGSDRVTYQAWPCKVCNNNRPANRDPGERSSQYAAESSCRERYGTLTEWMTTIDIDEYLVPMKQNAHGEYNWNAVLDEMDQKNISIMKFLSSRGKPRMEFMELLEDQSGCLDTDDMDRRKRRLPTEPCVTKMSNATFLQAYNCDFIRPPKPIRFDRARKEIYRTSFVLSHYIHYSLVTKDTVESYKDFHVERSGATPTYSGTAARKPEVFMNELTQGALVHARDVLPHETRRRSAECSHGSNFPCTMGYLCEDSVEFVDEVHQDNVFQNPDGKFCNCWRNKVIDDVLVPKLEQLLSNTT